MGRLDSFRRRVDEGRDVMAASEFARWVFFSGLIQLCKENSQDGFFKVDGALLQWTCEHLIEQCNERFRANNFDPSFEQAEFQSLHEKIDMMAGYLSRLSVAPSVVILNGGQGQEADAPADAPALPLVYYKDRTFGESSEVKEFNEK